MGKRARALQPHHDAGAQSGQRAGEPQPAHAVHGPAGGLRGRHRAHGAAGLLPPPYHSKYNPIERCWGILEHHWNGALLDSLDAVLGFAGTMRWKGKAPVVQVVTTTYHTGVALTKAAMAEVETHLARLAGLEKWFLDIVPPPGEAGTSNCS